MVIARVSDYGHQVHPVGEEKRIVCLLVLPSTMVAGVYECDNKRSFQCREQCNGVGLQDLCLDLRIQEW